MKFQFLIISFLFLTGACSTLPAAQSAAFESLAEKPVTFTSNGGETVDAFEGALRVAENRNNPDSRMITLRYVRFPATTEKTGPPIIYLSGGPGGSGIDTAKGRRFPLFMAMRNFGDVIALDQRGTGKSDTPPPCTSSVIIDPLTAISDEDFADRYRQGALECAAQWKAQNVDLGGYTTLESAHDLNALRRHLGAEKISLWGISYGSHLALATMKYNPDILDRVILASVEGLDQTVKLPSRTDQYFSDLGRTIGDPQLPDLIRSVHEQLEKEPVLMTLNLRNGKQAPYLFKRQDMQVIASFMISDPASALQLTGIYRAVQAGEYAPAAQLLAFFAEPGEPLKFQAMPLAMDRASGISERRLKQVQREAQSSLLGDYLNFPMPQLVPIFTELDLGQEFREGPNSDVPTLVFTGTLDGRTYPTGQREAVKNLTNLTHVTVENAGHNPFTTSPDVLATMEDFMSGKKVNRTTIAVDIQAPQ